LRSPAQIVGAFGPWRLGGRSLLGPSRLTRHLWGRSFGSLRRALDGLLRHRKSHCDDGVPVRLKSGGARKFPAPSL